MNPLDRAISFFSPRWAAERAAYRFQLSKLTNDASGVHREMEKVFGGRNAGGYEAGKRNRVRGRTIGSPHENDQPRDQINLLRYRAWNLYRNNPQARKTCRTLGAKVIGRGLSPQPQSTRVDGTPFVEFRRRARQVWARWVKEADFRGKPGNGGQHFTSLAKTALRQTILSGGVLYRFQQIDRKQQAMRDLLLPFQVQLVHIDRLDEAVHGNNKFYGVELDTDGRVLAYHILKGGIADDIKGMRPDTIRVTTSEMRHLFAEEDIDQILGSSWFGAMLLTADDRRGYEYSELTAAEMASCIVLGYRRSSGQVGNFGVAGPNSDRSLTDADGNPVTRMQAGMFVDLGANGALDLVNPSRPNANAEGFLSHLVRSEAVSMPGIKSSTLTGDYRASSFSSERSADNDTWPEIEEIQDWFSAGFCQPIYDQCITTAVLNGAFADVPDFSVADFLDRRRDYLETNWQGPVPRSINPKDDADAATRRVKNGQSAPQLEAAKEGRDWRENVDAIHEYIEYCEERGVPEFVWQQALGYDAKGAAPPAQQGEQPPATEQQEDEAVAARLRNSGFFSMNRG